MKPITFYSSLLLIHTVFRYFSKVWPLGTEHRMLSKAFCVIISFLLVPLASCQPRITEQGKRQLRAAAKLIEEKSYAVAIDELNQFLKSYPASHEVCEAYYLLGLSRVYSDQLDQARDDFESALATADMPILGYYARISLANLAFEQRDYSTAVKFYGSYFDKLPRRAPFQLAYYRYGQALQAVGQWKQADVQFARILYLFPKDQIVPSTQELFGQTHYAIELGRFSSFELADQQRQELPDLAAELPRVMRSRNGWYYVNLYGKFSDLVQAEKALEQIKPRVDQARIVPSE